MTGDDATLTVIDALEALEIDYLLTGSFASNHYGIPRSSEDADFVIHIGDTPMSEIMGKLPPAFQLDPQISFETATLSTRHVINVPGIRFKIELFHLSDDPHNQQRFHRRCRVPVLGRLVYLPTAEDVIVTKLRWSLRLGRGKDRDDARDVIAVQGDRLDWDYIHSWCAQHGTRALLEEIRRSIPPL